MTWRERAWDAVLGFRALAQFLSFLVLCLLTILVFTHVLVIAIAVESPWVMIDPRLYVLMLYEIYGMCGYDAVWFKSYGPPVITVFLLLLALPAECDCHGLRRTKP